MADGVPLSEAALRRRRRQRRRAAALGAAQVVGGGIGLLAGGCQSECTRPVSSALGTHQLAQGGGGSDDFVDVRWHVVTVLRCLAETLELQGFLEVQGQKDAGTETAEAKVPPWCGLNQSLLTLEGRPSARDPSQSLLTLEGRPSVRALNLSLLTLEAPLTESSYSGGQAVGEVVELGAKVEELGAKAVGLGAKAVGPASIDANAVEFASIDGCQVEFFDALDAFVSTAGAVELASIDAKAVELVGVAGCCGAFALGRGAEACSGCGGGVAPASVLGSHDRQSRPEEPKVQTGVAAAAAATGSMAGAEAAEAHGRGPLTESSYSGGQAVGVGPLTILGVVAEVGNDGSAACRADAGVGTDAAFGPGFGRLTIPGVVAEVGNDFSAACCKKLPAVGGAVEASVGSDDALRDFSDSAACTPHFVESASSPRRVLAVSATASLDPSVVECGDVFSGLSISVAVDVVEPLVLAVLQPPTRPGKGKGEGQKKKKNKFVCSLAASSTDPERPEESEDLLGGGAFYDTAHVGESLAEKVVFVEVGKKGSLCGRWLGAISLLICFFCCCLNLRVGNFSVSELGRSTQFFEVQETFSGASTRGELSVAAEGSAELQLSEGDFALAPRGVEVVGVGPAADTGRKSRSKSKTAAKSRKRAWQAFFVSLSVKDPPYTKHEKNQFFKKLEAAFLSNDRDGDEFISFSELQRADTRLVPGRGKEFFREADLNRDGVLGFDEYLELEFGG